MADQRRSREHLRATSRGEVPMPGPRPLNAEEQQDYDLLRANALADPVEREHVERVRREADRLRVQDAARSMIAAESWTPPPDQGSWAEQLAAPERSVSWLIDRLAFAGANIVVLAQAKSGKTSLVLNVAHSLLAGEALFGHFEVEPLASGRGLSWWNAELVQEQAESWLRGLALSRPEDFYPLHLRGYNMPFHVQTVEDWAVRWLSARRVSVWILDPQSALFEGDENSNTELSAWLRAIDRIKRRAGVETVLLVHHVAETTSTGSDGDDSNAGRLLKGRGASRLSGWADVLWSYSGRFDEPRYLAALGRDVDLPPFGGIHMSPDTRLLRFDGVQSSPARDKAERMAALAWESVKATPTPPLKATALQDLLPGRKAADKRKWIALAVSRGWLTSEPGPGNSTLYSLGAESPIVRRLRVADDREDDSANQ